MAGPSTGKRLHTEFGIPLHFFPGSPHFPCPLLPLVLIFLLLCRLGPDLMEENYAAHSGVHILPIFLFTAGHFPVPSGLSYLLPGVNDESLFYHS